MFCGLWSRKPTITPTPNPLCYKDSARDSSKGWCQAGAPQTWHQPWPPHSKQPYTGMARYIHRASHSSHLGWVGRVQEQRTPVQYKRQHLNSRFNRKGIGMWSVLLDKNIPAMIPPNAPHSPFALGVHQHHGPPTSLTVDKQALQTGRRTDHCSPSPPHHQSLRHSLPQTRAAFWRHIRLPPHTQSGVQKNWCAHRHQGSFGSETSSEVAPCPSRHNARVGRTTSDPVRRIIIGPLHSAMLGGGSQLRAITLRHISSGTCPHSAFCQHAASSNHTHEQRTFPKLPQQLAGLGQTWPRSFELV